MRKGCVFMSKKKKKDPNDAASYSGDAFLHNPVASVNDCTGIAPRVPDRAGSPGGQKSEVREVMK